MNINFIIKQFLIVIFLTQITVCSTDDKKLSSRLLECLLAECASIQAELNKLDRGLSSMQKDIQHMAPGLKEQKKLELESQQLVTSQEYLLNKHLDRQDVMTTIDSVIDQIVFKDEKQQQEEAAKIIHNKKIRALKKTVIAPIINDIIEEALQISFDNALHHAIDQMSLATATETIAPESSYLTPLKAPCQKQSSGSNVASSEKLKDSHGSRKKKILNHEKITQQQPSQLNRQKKLSAQNRNDAYNQAQALKKANHKNIQLAVQKRNSSLWSFCSIL